MLKTRVMPCLLLRNRALVKTIRFKDPTYIGDPINTVRIYNEMEVDELIFLDIMATVRHTLPQFGLIEEIASECFMPFSYGGGVSTLDTMKTLFGLGTEKITLNSHAHENPAFITKAADRFGSQSIIVSIDVKKNFWGQYEVYTQGGRNHTGMNPIDYAKKLEQRGAGEIFLTSIDRDGTFKGYDLMLVNQVSQAVNIPVIACGGAGCVDDFGVVVKEAGASAVAAGSMVVYQGKNRSVLISFPPKPDLKRVLTR
ncbi:MAG: glycosyl amidation-associated protein WbuZ [Kiritimatiellae bacterium]|nr:glycosyl amidation-associated protein WbuZ [Kiritimatiellia bacterium]